MHRERKPIGNEDGQYAFPKLFTQDEWKAIADSLPLSPKRKEIVKLIMCALSDKQIAQTLKISVRTVREHMSYIFDGLNANGRVEVVLAVFARFRELSAQRRHRQK